MMRFAIRYELEVDVIDEEKTRLWLSEIIEATEKFVYIAEEHEIFIEDLALVQVQFREEDQPRAKFANLADVLRGEGEEAAQTLNHIDGKTLEAIRFMANDAKQISQNPLFADDEHARGMANGLEKALAEVEKRPAIIRMPNGHYAVEGSNSND